jgi:hypothetical protein
MSTTFSAKIKNEAGVPTSITITIPSSTISIPIVYDGTQAPVVKVPDGVMSPSQDILGLSFQNVVLICIGAAVVGYYLHKKGIDYRIIIVGYILLIMTYAYYHERSISAVKLTPSEELELFAKRFQAVPTILSATSLIGSTLPMFAF